MGKKRLFTGEKRAQITIFMILGILLLLLFLFLMQVASHAQKSQFLTEQEKVFSKAFKKESLRLYVDDCLQDELEKGLILLGKQGTLWADQPGGIKPFSEGINGITYGPDKIFYSITDEPYFQFPGAYPCDSESSPPSFCQYRRPNTTVGFGTSRLFTSTFTSDLRQYLLNRTAWCVQGFILANVSSRAEIVSTEIQLDLAVNDEGLGVKVNYPLKFKVGGEEIFSLSTFDFLYPSRFQQLLETATSPLAWEQKFVDFNYTPETFTRPTFTYASEQNVGPCTFDSETNYFLCERSLPLDTYQSLSTTMVKESLPNGDDIFTFTPALYEIVDNPEPYFLRIARQNRPPALDYIQRAACPAEGYDYLVIKDDERYGDIDLVPHAIDADEDGFTFSFSEGLGPAINGIVHRTAEDVANYITNGRYTVTAAATDEHGKTDSQEVRVLVDRPIRVDLSLKFPESYGINSFIGGGGDITPLYVVSKEDPILLQATIPAGTETSNVQTIVLTYTDGASVNTIGRLDYNNPGLSTEQCYNLPLQREGEASTCTPDAPYDLNSYYNTNERINRLADFNYYTFHPFQRITSTDPGTLSLNFNTQYCGVPMDEQRSIINVQVKECAPVSNPEHPYAFPYEEFKFGLKEDGSTDFSNYLGDTEAINPLEATHSCCVGDPALPAGWRIKTAEEGDCFTNPLPGCYGRVPELTTGSNKGYILEQEFAACDGTRGNICGSRQGRLYQEKLRCGTPTENPECRSDIAAACQGELAFGLIETENGDKGWCNGKMGCVDFCTSAIVYTGPEEGTYFAGEDINTIAQENKITSAQEMAGFGFKCGCSGVVDGTRCDSGFDGWFNGVCENGRCNDVIGTPGAQRCNTEVNFQKREVLNSVGTTWDDAALADCAANEYCREEGAVAECKPQRCTPNTAICFNAIVSSFSVEERRKREEELRGARIDQAKVATLCNARGSGVEYALKEIREDVYQACPAACTANTVIVEVLESDGDTHWECRSCGSTDWQEPNPKRCVKGGAEGVCKWRTSGSNQITYECLPS